MENISEDDGWEFVNLGDQQSFGIKTAGLEEKATACQMLVRRRTLLTTFSSSPPPSLVLIFSPPPTPLLHSPSLFSRCVALMFLGCRGSRQV